MGNVSYIVNLHAQPVRFPHDLQSAFGLTQHRFQITDVDQVARDSAHIAYTFHDLQTPIGQVDGFGDHAKIPIDKADVVVPPAYGMVLPEFFRHVHDLYIIMDRTVGPPLAMMDLADVVVGIDQPITLIGRYEIGNASETMVH